MGQVLLYLGKDPVGTVRWQTCEGGLSLEARCPFSPNRIYRLLLCTEQGTQKLGVMLPEGPEFLLKKVLPEPAVPICGLIDCTLPGEPHLPGLPLALSAFVPVDDRELEELACPQGRETLYGAWWRDLRLYLFPLDSETVSPMAPFFCLTTLLRQNGRDYGVFCRKDGRCVPLSDTLFTDAVV